MKKQEGITFTATLNKAWTSIDGGWKVTFDIPESDSLSVLQLSQLRNTVLAVGIVPNLESEDQDFGLDLSLEL
jgi:hypothetical protein